VAGAGFGDAYAAPLAVGLAIGPVYRFRVTDIPEHPGVEVFPTVEMVDRLYPPPGQALRFPVPVDLTLDELLMAAEGKFITRVIYVEDPQLALPVAEKSPSDTRWIDVGAGEDPLVTADGLGRPVAILRLGGRVPEQNQLDPSFVYGGPQPMVYDRANSTATGGVLLTPHEEALPPAR
jgi:hypothetical protein